MPRPGTNTPMLLARSRHASMRSLERYARPGPEALARHVAAAETISTSFVESAVNQLVSKRMVKKQQMRWTPRGTHLLSQVRARVLNDQLADEIHRWYPAFTR